MTVTASLHDAGVRGFIIKRARRKFSRVPRITGSRVRQPYWVLRGVSLDVETGEAVFLVGNHTQRLRSVQRLLCGLLTPDEGSATTPSRSLFLTTPRLKDVRTLSVGQAIRFLAGIYGLTDAEVDERFETIVEESRVQRIVHRQVDDTSNAILRQIAFTIGIHAPVQLLALDGMAQVGSPDFASTCVPKLRARMEEGLALVVHSSDPRLLTTLSTRIVQVDATGAEVVDLETGAAIIRAAKATVRTPRPSRPPKDERHEE